MERDSPLLQFYDIDSAAERAQLATPERTTAQALSALSDESVWQSIKDPNVQLDPGTCQNVQRAETQFTGVPDVEAPQAVVSKPYHSFEHRGVHIQSRLVRFSYNIETLHGHEPSVTYLPVTTHEYQAEITFDDIAVGFTMPSELNENNGDFLLFGQ